MVRSGIPQLVDPGHRSGIEVQTVGRGRNLALECSATLALVLDMHVVIGETLDLARECLPRNRLRQGWPAFSADPSPVATPARSAA